MLGSVAPPSAAEEASENESASDVPSHSSASSEDEEVDNDAAVEMWKKTLSVAPGESQDQTHKDFFENLVKDVEGEVAQLSVDDDEQHDDDLALDERIFLAVTSAVSMAEQAQHERNVEDEDDSEIIFTSNIISEIGMNIASQMGLEGVQAMRCAEDVEDCLCFVYGQSFDANTQQYVVQTVQKLMLDRADQLEQGAWFDPADEDEDDEQSAAASAKNTTASSSPEPVALAPNEDTAAGAKSVSKTLSSAAHQTPARTPHRATTTTPATNTATKRSRINYDEIAPGTPAWMIPKSPLDSLFRTGFGGIGQSKLQDVMALVEDSDAEEDEESEPDEHQRLAGGEQSDVDTDDDPVRLDDLPNHFGRELLQHAALSQDRSSAYLLREKERELLGDFDDAPLPDDDYYVRASTAVQCDTSRIMKNPSLNAMLTDSYNAHLSQYAAANREKEKGAAASQSSRPTTGRSAPSSPYDYDEATVGTSLDSEGYLQRLRAAKRAIPRDKPALSPKKSVAEPASPQKSPKTKKPVVAAVVRSSKHSLAETHKHSRTDSHGDEHALMLESPGGSVLEPKKTKKDAKLKKKRASSGASLGVSRSQSVVEPHKATATEPAADAKKKKASSAKKLTRASSGSRLLEPTEAQKKRADKPHTAVASRWKS